MPTGDNDKLGIVEERQRQIDECLKAEIAHQVFRQLRRLLAQRTVRVAKLPTVPCANRLPIEAILEAVATVAGIQAGDIVGPGRAPRIAWPRYVAILMASELRPDLSTPALGRAFGRDHSTIVVARQCARQRIADPAHPSARWYVEARAALLARELP